MSMSNSSTNQLRAVSEAPRKSVTKSFKGRSARKSTAVKPRASTPNFDFSNSNGPKVAAATRAQRALDALQFSNPGLKNSDVFTSGFPNGRRNAFEKAKKRTKIAVQETPVPSKPSVPSKFSAPSSKTCDCIRPGCNGCFPKCRKCESRRCGLFCQVNQTWTVVEAVIPGSKLKPLRNELTMNMGSEYDSDSESSDSDNN